jgi:hypothetical protein
VKSGVECQRYEKSATFVKRDASNMNATGRQTLAFGFHQANQEKKKPSGPKIKTPSNVSSRSFTPGMPSSRSGQEKSEEHQLVNSRTVLEVTVRNATAMISLRDRDLLSDSAIT